MTLLSGILLVDKEAGRPSYTIIRRLKRLTPRKQKIGFSGTLDPLATGLLPVLLGRGTRIADLFHTFAKTYRAEVELGRTTDSFDSDGNETSRFQGSVSCTTQDIRLALAAFLGTYRARPPAFSAKKIAGTPAYRRARRNEAVMLPEQTHYIYAARLIQHQGKAVTFTVTVSRGTYIRTIAHDLGRRLGPGAVLTGLRRLAIGPFQVTNALPQAQLTAETIASHCRSLDDMLFPLCSRHMEETAFAAVSTGSKKDILAHFHPQFTRNAPFLLGSPEGKVLLVVIWDPVLREHRMLYRLLPDR